MNPPRHRHSLKLKNKEVKPFECSGCKELGFGPRYQCEMKDCHFVLHEVCFKASPNDRPRTHPFMGNCRFQFLRELPAGSNSRFCDACGRDIRGYLYHDKHKHKLDLHPCCMNLQSTMSDPAGRMKLILTDKVPSSCVKCDREVLPQVQSKQPFRGWSYVSSCGNHCYHVYCIKKFLLDNWERGYFNNVSSSSSSSSRGRTRSRGEIARRCNSVRSGRSSNPSSALARRSSSAPRFMSVMIKLMKIGLRLIVAVVTGNPFPLLLAPLESLIS